MDLSLSVPLMWSTGKIFSDINCDTLTGTLNPTHRHLKCSKITPFLLNFLLLWHKVINCGTPESTRFSVCVFHCSAVPLCWHFSPWVSGCPYPPFPFPFPSPPPFHSPRSSEGEVPQLPPPYKYHPDQMTFTFSNGLVMVSVCDSLWMWCYCLSF